MIHRNFRLQSCLLLLTFVAAILCGCSHSNEEQILGHWRAERVNLQGVSVPMGPEFVVSKEELRSLDGEISIPVSSITVKGNTVTLEAPLGLGLSFYFESPDRMYFDAPLIGKLYYRKVISRS